MYANLQGLAKTYVDARIIPNSRVLLDFVQAFNKSHDVVEIIDAGNDKEAADSKIKATFNLYSRNLHCKHILFSGSGDNSYAGFLRQHVPVEGVSQHITLIEALPFAAYLEQVSRNFQTAKFPGVFRDSKLVINARYSSQETMKPMFPTVEQQEPPSAWATTSMKAALPTITNKENTPPSLEAKPAPAVSDGGAFVYQNSKGERVDRPINKDLFDKDTVYKLKGRKLCNKFWLLKHCDQGEFCEHGHKGPLSKKEIENLRYVARFRPCQQELYCCDPNCFDGHRCVYGMKCTKNDCWFSDDMHRVEVTGPVKVPVVLGSDNYWAKKA